MTLKDQLMDWAEAHRSDPFAARRKDIRPRRLLRDGQRVGGMMSHKIPRDSDGAYRIDNRIDKKLLW